MKKLAAPDRKVCVACGVCIKACPKGAISIYKGCYAVVDEAKCAGLGMFAYSLVSKATGKAAPTEPLTKKALFAHSLTNYNKSDR